MLPTRHCDKPPCVGFQRGTPRQDSPQCADGDAAAAETRIFTGAERVSWDPLGPLGPQSMIPQMPTFSYPGVALPASYQGTQSMVGSKSLQVSGMERSHQVEQQYMSP